MLAEVCVDTVSGAVAAQEAGADRIELCAALGVGGLTPSAGLVEETLAATSLPVQVLIRPRDGDFIYDRSEVAAMLRDIALVARSGAHGVVVGALTVDGDIDVETCERMVGAAEGLSVTFHRAFDLARDPFAALSAIADLGGVDRVLTSGQEATALEGASLIADLVLADRLTIMAGGGITAGNVALVRSRTGVSEIHFSAREPVDSPARYRNTRVGLSAPDGDYTRRATSQARIAAIIGRSQVS